MDQSLKQYRSQDMRSAMCRACAVLLVLCSAQAGLAQQSVTAKPVAVAAVSPQTTIAPAAAKPVAEEEETAKPSKPGNEGIKIHGHWVLQVKNVDGTLGERREFNNSLVPSTDHLIGGDALLVGLLSGSMVPGDAGVLLVQEQSAAGGADCVTPGNSCFLMTTANSPLIQQTGQQALTNFYPFLAASQSGLALSASMTGGTPVNWIFSGNFVVPAALTTVNVVQSVIPFCLNSQSPAYRNIELAGPSVSGSSADLAPTACTGNVGGSDFVAPAVLTSTSVMSGGVVTPLRNLVQGQIITVTVTLSFS
jgi:hypothetical protein